MASLFLDHNLSPLLARLLERAGHSATTAIAMHLELASDREILEIAGRAGLIIITADEDFITLHQTSGIGHAGILILPEFRRAESSRIADAIAWLLDSGRPLTTELHSYGEVSGWSRNP